MEISQVKLRAFRRHPFSSRHRKLYRQFYSHSDGTKSFASVSNVLSAIRFIAGTKLVYILNPKSGCTSVMSSLWQHWDRSQGSSTYRGNPHLDPSPFISDESIIAQLLGMEPDAEWFSVVRNPYVRLLSAFLDKSPFIRADREVWVPFAKRHALNPRRLISFLDFLYVLADDRPEFIDAHFRPQWANLHQGFLKIDFIGRLEQFSGTSNWLLARGIETSTWQEHKTGAAERLKQFFGPTEIRMAQKIYERDFSLFGYSEDISKLEPVGGVTSFPAAAGMAEALFRAHNAESEAEWQIHYDKLMYNGASPETLAFAKLDRGVVHPDGLHPVPKTPS